MAVWCLGGKIIIWTLQQGWTGVGQDELVRIYKQAGAELGQAQLKLELDLTLIITSLH